MTEIPSWWLILTAVFVVVSLIYLAVLTTLVIFVIGFVKRLEPKVHSLTGKVESIATKVDDIASTTKQTLETVSVHTKRVTGTVDSLVQLAKGPAKTAAPVFGYAALAFRIIKILLAAKGALGRRKR